MFDLEDRMLMAELTFSLANLPTIDQMPHVCAGCGQVVTSKHTFRLKVHRSYPGPDLTATVAGFSNEEQRNWHQFQQLFAQGKCVVELPVCWWHRWIMPTFIGIKSMTEHRVSIQGLADSFVQEMKRRGWSDI